MAWLQATDDAVPRWSADAVSGLLPVMLLHACLLLAAWLDRSRDLDGTRLVDPTDSFMRVVLLLEKLARGSIAEAVTSRDGAPFGYAMHWTLPVDLLILALAAPVAPWLGWEEAVRLAAPLVGPCGVLLLLLAAAWAVRPLGGAILGRDVGLLLLTAAPIVSYGRFGVADHHILQLAAILATAGGILRILLEPRRPWGGLATASAAALATWIGGEGLLAAMLLLAGLGVHQAWTALPSRAVTTLAIGFPSAILACLLLDPPAAGLAATEPDRLSLPHLMLASLAGALLALSAAPPIRRLGRAPRLAALTAAAILAASGWLWLFPSALQGVDASLPPLARLVHWRFIRELRPITDAATALSLLALPLLALAAFLVAAAGRPGARPSRAEALLAAVTIVVLAAALFHRRFAIYPAAAGAVLLATRLASWWPEGPRRLVAVLAVLLAVAGAARLSLLTAEEVRTSDEIACTLEPLRAAVASIRGAGGGGPPIVLTELDRAPRLLLASDARTISGPYHRNGAGIEDTVRMLYGDPDQARSLLAARRVDLILLCPGSGAELRDSLDPDGRSLAAMIIAGTQPKWLRPIPVAGIGFRLIEVVR